MSGFVFAIGIENSAYLITEADGRPTFFELKVTSTGSALSRKDIGIPLPIGRREDVRHD